MAHISYDQSSSTRCMTHGNRAGAVFVRPDAGDSFPADYACFHCARELGYADGFIGKEDALHLIDARHLQMVSR